MLDYWRADVVPLQLRLLVCGRDGTLLVLAATATDTGAIDTDRKKLRFAPTCINRLRPCVSKRGLGNRPPVLNARSVVRSVVTLSALAFPPQRACPFAYAPRPAPWRVPLPAYSP